MGNNKKRKGLFWILPIFAVVFTIILLQSFFIRRQTEFREIPHETGVLDITDVDMSEEVFTIPNNWDYYPGKLYTSEDFASGNIDETTADGAIADNQDFGTYRLMISAKPNQYYTICGFSVDYGTNVFVNGSLVASYGKVSDNKEEYISQVGYMTIPLCSGEDGKIEIIYHYANYVHREGGFIQPTFISTPQNMENMKAGNDLVSLSISGGLLFLMLYFLLCAAVQRKTDFICLAFCCLLMALRDQNFYNLHFLPPDFSWTIKYRIFILIVMLLPGSVLLVLKSIYPKATKHWPLYVYLGIVLVSSTLIMLMPTHILSLISAATYFASIPYLIYLIFGVVRHYIKQKGLDLADGLTLFGFLLMLSALLYEAFLTGRSSLVTHYGFAAFGTIGFVLIIAIAISIRTQKKEIAFAESRSRSEMLERMNRLNIDFLHKVAHELRTPLTVISGYAQLTGIQLAANSLNSETPENLKTIQQEAQRLADMVTRLMEYSYGIKREVNFVRIEVKELLDNVTAIATPVCMKNNNTVVTECYGCSDIHGNFETLLQIFVNLIVNANKHTINGTITVKAIDEHDKKYVKFQVCDTGTGIAQEQLPYIFEEGYSCDGSSGLGLAICREAVEIHGGDIWVESTGENGTVFSFTVLKEDKF